MADKFSIRRIDKKDKASSPTGLVRAMFRLQTRISMFVGPYPVSADGRYVGTRPTARGARKLTARLFRDRGANRVVVRTGGKAVYAVKRIPPQEPTKPPVQDTEGTRQVDEIYSAVHYQFDNKWTVRDMGIYANKPGEHGHSNAWDAGTDPGAPAEVQHQRILAMATFIRDEALAGRLPVYGVIVLDKYWKVGMGKTWAKYNGTKHVSHFHVSGKPSITGWV